MLREILLSVLLPALKSEVSTWRWLYDGTILKIVFGIDSGFVELKTKEVDSDGN